MSAAPRARQVGREAFVFWGVAAFFAVLLAALRVAAQPLLLAFAGVLFGTALRGAAEWASRKFHWKVRWSLAACLALLLALSAGAAIWVIPNVADQVASLSQRLFEAYEDLRRSAATSPLGSHLVQGSGNVGQQLGKFAVQAAGVLASAAGAVGAVLFVAFVALYVAGGPEPYRHGLIRLVPPGSRERAREVLDALGSTLRRWLLGRIVSMSAVGLVTTLGLWVIGIPLPITLGLIAGLLGFVPNIGPIVSAVPAVLLAVTVGPLHVVYVLVLYVGINLADGYGLTPWIQKKAVAVPPALIITGQVIAGALWGVLGVMFATPLLACLVVLVRELYVRQVEGAASSTDRNES